MPDMLVKLYNLPDPGNLEERVAQQGVQIKRALAGDKSAIAAFVRANFNESWANSVEVSLANVPSHCFVAVKKNEIIGFACYDAVVRDYFGPTGVLPEYRGKGVGALLLTRTLQAMQHDGYAYAIIGWAVDAIPFYERWANAVIIPDSFPGAYEAMIGVA